MNTAHLVRSISLTAVATAFMMVGGLATADDDAPSGTVTIKEHEAGLIFGGDWGHGTLNFGEEVHMFHMGGIKVGGLGFTASTVTGNVYNLTNLGDFSGVYLKAEAGATLAKGLVGTWVKNAKGVSIHLVQTTKGAALSIGVEGLKITLEH
ncbi:MAG: hypothetical protein ACI80M_000515 [Gammaproteobacteria bacterium]|jgi:hypothetical protein